MRAVLHVVASRRRVLSVYDPTYCTIVSPTTLLTVIYTCADTVGFDRPVAVTAGRQTLNTGISRQPPYTQIQTRLLESELLTLVQKRSEHWVTASRQHDVLIKSPSCRPDAGGRNGMSFRSFAATTRRRRPCSVNDRQPTDINLYSRRNASNDTYVYDLLFTFAAAAAASSIHLTSYSTY